MWTGVRSFNIYNPPVRELSSTYWTSGWASHAQVRGSVLDR